MEFKPSPEHDFFPSTLEHRPLQDPEKVALKAYFLSDGSNEHEGYTPSEDAVTQELADFEAWVWGLRLWGRETIVRASIGATELLAQAWEKAIEAGDGDDVTKAAAYEQILAPAEAISYSNYWANIPGEEKALRIMESEKPLPFQWRSEPLCSLLKSKPFIWGANASWALMQGILIKRDPAAMKLAHACCGAVQVRMLEGRSQSEAIADVKGRMIKTLREWMGYKW